VQQIAQAYGETILRLANKYGLPVTVGVLAVLTAGFVLRAAVKLHIGRGPSDSE
jgi:hypothetical protein